MSKAKTVVFKRREWRRRARITGPTLLALALLGASTASLHAQAIDDAVMLPGKQLSTSLVYARDTWEDYWEGTLKRTNGNIGRITTQSVTWTGDYGLTRRLNVVATLPYVWTDASQGVLHGSRGLQDFTLAAKYQLLETPFTSRGSLRVIAVAAATIPASDYTPDFLPLSIGSASRRFAGRLTVNFQAKEGWFLNGSAAYTWRGIVTLDRPSYYTDGRLFLSDEVALPDVFDYTLSAGYSKNKWHVPISFSQQNTLGGGDIRRQDAPFVSNRANFSKVDAMVKYSLPGSRNLALRLAGTYTVRGRNVGQSATLTAGVVYTFHF